MTERRSDKETAMRRTYSEDLPFLLVIYVLSCLTGSSRRMFSTDFIFDGNELVFAKVELLRLKHYLTAYIQASMGYHVELAVLTFWDVFFCFSSQSSSNHQCQF